MKKQELQTVVYCDCCGDKIYMEYYVVKKGGIETHFCTKDKCTPVNSNQNNSLTNDTEYDSIF